MAVEITIPSLGESITEVVLSKWHKSSGDYVEKDEDIFEVESDKITTDIPAPESGIIKISAEEGTELEIGAVVGSIDPDAERPSGGDKSTKEESDETSDRGQQVQDEQSSSKVKSVSASSTEQNSDARATSLAKKVAADRGIKLADIKGTGPSGRITRDDVLAASERRETSDADAKKDGSSARETAPARSSHDDADSGDRTTRREKMTKLRQRIAQRLVEAQHNAAMLTTFNEVDMSEVMRLRAAYKESFSEKHGIGLGFMSFFIKACISALKAYPRVNAYIVGHEIEYHDFMDISIAVGTEKGLVVPIIRNAHRMGFADIEQSIKDLATRAKDGKLTIDDMTGGTFTISNGGVYGSLNSTPILNPPQSGILGMHTIKKRPVEHPDKPGEIVLRPMMNLALSYDHRIIDGAEAVGFLVHVKNCIERPERMLLDV